MKALDRLPALSQTVSQLLGTLAQSVPDIKGLELLINKDPAPGGSFVECGELGALQSADTFVNSPRNLRPQCEASGRPDPALL